ncbi:MAG: hypothetical protein J5639_02335 [Bacteroidales bacterium]|nr:hypothetical protein [Bacteroidales bacterium]
MKAAVLRERPFEFLRRKGSLEAYPEQTVANWYIARAYVLDFLKDVAFIPGMPGSLHVVVEGDSPLLLAVVRHLALYSHFLNFVEYDRFGNRVCSNRSVITVISSRDEAGIIAELEKDENLGNLLQVCRYSVFGKLYNEDSYLDLEIEVATEQGDAAAMKITEADVNAFVAARHADEIFSIDTRKALYAGHAYVLGGVIDNLPHEDIFGAGRYVQALDTFRYLLFNDTQDRTLVTPAWESNIVAVRNGISDIMCTDCFELREKAVVKQYPSGRRLSEKERRTVWEQNNFALSLSEHNRWVVEKLIMGFRPYVASESNKYDTLFSAEKRAFCNQLKKSPADPAHLDICSYWDLRRTDPDNLKYDSFLMLAIPLILGKVRQ